MSFARRSIAEPTSVSRIVPTVLPSRQSNTQWNSLLRDMVDAALFRIGRRVPMPSPLVQTARAQSLLKAYRRAHRTAQSLERRLRALGFGTDGREHYTRSSARQTLAQTVHEARIRTVQGIRATALTELVGAFNAKEQRAILRVAAKKLARV